MWLKASLHQQKAENNIRWGKPRHTEHPDLAPVQKSSQSMGQAEGPPDEKTSKALQTSLPDAYIGVRLTVGLRWTGEEWECKNREKKVQLHVNLRPVSTTGYVACLIISLLIKPNLFSWVLVGCIPCAHTCACTEVEVPANEKMAADQRGPQTCSVRNRRDLCAQCVGVHVATYHH